MSMTTRQVGSRRHGSAIAMVSIFLLLVGIIAIGVAFQNQFTMSSISRAQHSYELVEICESAIEECAAQIGQDDVFPPSIFQNQMKDWMFAMYTDDENALKAALPGFTVSMGSLLDKKGGNLVTKIFLSMQWPDSYNVPNKPTPNAAAMAARVPSFKGPLAPVSCHPVTFHRDFYQGLWQDWGVLEFTATATADEGGGRTATRTVSVDRLFALNVTPNVIPGMPQKIKSFTSVYKQDNHNLRTVIERS